MSNGSPENNTLKKCSLRPATSCLSPRRNVVLASRQAAALSSLLPRRPSNGLLRCCSGTRVGQSDPVDAIGQGQASAAATTEILQKSGSAFRSMTAEAVITGNPLSAEFATTPANDLNRAGVFSHAALARGRRCPCERRPGNVHADRSPPCYGERRAPPSLPAPAVAHDISSRAPSAAKAWFPDLSVSLHLF